MMNYELFKGIVQEKILEYMAPEYANATVEVTTVNKVNRQMDALCIHNNDDKVALNLYINQMYEQYLETEDLQNVLMDAAKNFQEAMQNKPKTLEGLDFESFRENVVFALVNKEQNREMLKDVVHRDYQDMAIIYRWVVSKEKDGISSTMVTDQLAKRLGVTEQELFERAMENTPRIMPTKVTSLQETIMELFCQDTGITMDEAKQMGMFDLGEEETSIVWVVTNEMGVNGASSILLTDEMAKIADRVGTDLYLLPSSIHEMLAVSTMFGSPESFARMVQDVNMSAVSLEDRLSNNVYFYDKEARTISMATDVPNKKLGDVVAEQSVRYDNEPIR